MPVDDFVEVCPFSELADGEVAEFIVRGTSIAVARIGGEYRAVSNVCPHAGGPIGDGEVEGGLVRCPSHGWGFDLTSGVCDLDPSIRLDTYPVRIRSGQVEVEIPTGG